MTSLSFLSITQSRIVKMAFILKSFICHSLLTPNNNNKKTFTFHIEKLPGHPVMSGMKAGPPLGLPKLGGPFSVWFTEPLYLFIISASPAPVCSGTLGSSMYSA